MELAETLELAPAACLDYFDAEYIRRSQADTPEYSGFTISAHILRAESVARRAEQADLPLMMLEPLAPVRIAIKHKQQKFLSQNCVHEFMRAEFVRPARTRR